VTPAITAIVPCRNERLHIEECVRSILEQDQPPGGLELIVVDGMSNDGTREILSRLSSEDPRLQVLDNVQKLTACAMNIGIRNARGRYIAIMGAHNCYASDYLLRSVETLARTGADAVGGAMICVAESYLQQAIAASHHSPFSVGGARWHNIGYEGPADTVFGGIYRREVFEKVGYFDEDLIRNQDDEFNLRLNRAGGKVWQSPTIKSWYWPRSSLSGLLRQYCQYGYWKVRVIQKHKIPASPRHLVPAAFLMLLCTLALLSTLSETARLLLVGTLAFYYSATVLASLMTAAKYGWKLLPALPAVFACYHFAYGYGFLRGVLDFVIFVRSDQRFAQINH
jgi:glycosyltransferase involved in cell wall biosynthesis